MFWDIFKGFDIICYICIINYVYWSLIFNRYDMEMIWIFFNNEYIMKMLYKYLIEFYINVKKD